MTIEELMIILGSKKQRGEKDMSELTLRNAFGDLYFESIYRKEGHYIVCRWYGFVTPEDIKLAGVAVLELMQSNAVSRLVVDTRKLEGSWADATSWVLCDWAPLALAMGLTHVAQIMSLDLITEETNRYFMAASGACKQMKMMSFETKQEAVGWLGSVYN
jgi:hypothetical protein